MDILPCNSVMFYKNLTSCPTSAYVRYVTAQSSRSGPPTVIVCVKVFNATSNLNLKLEIVKETALLSAINGTDVAPHCYGLVILEETKG